MGILPDLGVAFDSAAQMLRRGWIRDGGQSYAKGMEDRIRALESRLESLEAVEEIRRLKARYGELVDSRFGDDGFLAPDRVAPIADEIAALFTADAVWDGAALGVSRGRDEIRERFLASTLTFSWHFFVKPQIEVDGDTATGRWDILSPCTMPGDRPFWMAGVEDDRYEREDGVWKHKSMSLRVVFMSPYERGWARQAKAARS